MDRAEKSERGQRSAGTLERNQRICQGYAAMIPMHELVRIFGVSRQRVLQIVTRDRLSHPK